MPVAAIALIAISLAATFSAYRAAFTDPEHYDPPGYRLTVPYNYTIALNEALEQLAKVDQPTYVPLDILDTALGYFVLQREAFPNVTTWARYGLRELPAGQIFYPARRYGHNVTPDTNALQVLLLPEAKTMVILPPMPDGSPVIEKPRGDGVCTVASAEYGWDIAYVAPRPASPLPAVSPPVSPAPSVGDGLQLINRPEPFLLEPGNPISVTLQWRVTAPQPADIYSVVQVIDVNANAVINTEQHVLPYLYPSWRWQPGDVIPDLHTLVVPESLPDTLYRWGVGAYVPPGQRRLPVVSSEFPLSVVSNLWLWGAGRLTAPPPTPVLDGMTPLDAQLGDSIRLEGVQIDRSDTAWTVNLYWQTSALPEGDYVLYVHAMKNGGLIAQVDERPNGGQTPTWSWRPGQIIVTRVTLTLPENGDSPDALYVGLYNYPSLERLPVMQDGAPVEENRVLLWSER